MMMGETQATQAPSGSGGSAGRLRSVAPAVDFAGLLGAYLVFCGSYLRALWASAIPGGWDGVPHYAMAQVYARRGFPSLSGWLPEYFAGMPFPDFYPPLFYLLTAALARLGLPMRTVFFGVQTGILFAVVALTYLCTRRLTGSRAAGLLAGILAAGQLAARGQVSLYGLTLEATFEIGLATHPLGYVMLLLFYYFLLDTMKKPGAAAWATLALAGVILSSGHAVWTAGLLLLGLAGVEAMVAPALAKALARIGLYTAIGLVGVLLAACWLVPMLAHLRYAPTVALEPLSLGTVAYVFLQPGLKIGLVLLLATLRRDRGPMALGVSLLMLLSFIALPFDRYPGLRDLPFQAHRQAAMLSFLFFPLVGYAAAVAMDLWNQRIWGRVLVFLLFLGSAAASWHFDARPATRVMASDYAGYENVLTALGGRDDGRVLVEVGTHGLSDGFALQALVGATGGRSLTTVFREASLDALFANVLRNIFSERPEEFGLDSKIEIDQADRGTHAQHEARLRLFDVRYFAVTSPQVKRRLESWPGVHRESPPGTWELFAFDAPRPGIAVVPVYAPVLALSSFSVKRRLEEGVDFVRLGEEMFTAARLEVPLVRARAEHIEDIDASDWDRFPVALLTDYRYRDLERAFAALERYSRSHPVVFLDSEDPLAVRLRALAATRPTLRWVARSTPVEVEAWRLERLRDGASTDEAYRLAVRWGVTMTCRRLFDALDAVKVPLDGSPRLVRSVAGADTLTLALDRRPARPLAVWIHQGWFPTWQNPEGAPMYMATPTFQLTFMTGQTLVLKRGATLAHRMGVVITAAGLLLWLVLCWRMGCAQRAAGRAPVDSLEHPRTPSRPMRSDEESARAYLGSGGRLGAAALVAWVLLEVAWVGAGNARLRDFMEQHVGKISFSVHRRRPTAPPAASAQPSGVR